MRFKATEEQVAQMFANAVNASSPMGMGFLSVRNRTYKPAEFIDDAKRGCVEADYHDGRMVKLAIGRDGDGWRITRGHTPRGDYQSWARSYPTALDLVKSVGAEVIEPPKAA